MGTRGIEWLNTWRDTRVFAVDNQYVSLQSLMSSLRAIAGHRSLRPIAASATSFSNKSKLDPDAYCKKCRHRHKNRDCFGLRPELVPVGYKGSKQDKRDKSAADFELEQDSDSECEGAKHATSMHYNKNRTIYDNGASHHFVSSKELFTSCCV